MNKNPNIRQIVILAVVLCLGFGLLFSLILRDSYEFKGLSLSENPTLRPSYDVNGVALPPDPAFIMMRPTEVARVPIATRFDMPLGSEHGALSYDYQPFMMFNSERQSNHLGEDHNGIGGMDTDLGDSVYAVAAGRVIYSGNAEHGWGNVIIIAHRLPDGSEFQSFYAHLEHRFAINRTNVLRGEEIGTVGNGDGAYPAHLHFEIRASHNPNPGRGYFTEALNRLDPTGTIQKHRNAPADLLNPSPKIVRSTEFRSPVPMLPPPVRIE